MNPASGGTGHPGRLTTGPFLVAVTAGLLVVVSAPFMGELRRWIRVESPGQFVAIVGGAVALAAALGLGWAIVRIRARRLERYGLVAGALLVAAAYSRWSSLGNPDSDVVERVHFVQYGLLAWLFYRAWFPLGNASVLALTFVSTTTIGTFEEWFQWFIPARVGEVRDVLLNAAAIACGILFSSGIRPLGGLRRPGPRSLGYLAGTVALAAAALAGFVDSAHLGHEVRDPAIGGFRSIYSAAELRAHAIHRAEAWTANPPLVRPAGLSREDQYASEGLLHVRARNDAWTAGKATTAFFENLILERYFAPVLDAPSYVSATGHRWTAAHRAEVERRSREAGARPAAFISRAEGAFPILEWSATAFRTASAATVVMLLAIALALVRTSRETPTRRPGP